MLPGLEVVSVYVSCYIFLSVVNVESWPHQILRLTVLSTNRVILRLSTVDSTSDCLIYYLSSYACCDHTTHLSTVDSMSDYFPDSKLSMYVLCYWLSVVNEKAAHTPDSTSDYYQVMLPGICVVIMIKCERFYGYLLCFLDSKLYRRVVGCDDLM